MTVGVPVIVSRRGALPEVAGDAGVVVEPNDHAGLADAMRRFLINPQAAAAAAERGRARAAQYSWDASAAALYGAYQDAIGRNRRTRG
jgi:glycosyltransferase involved in cell wall biosynthesis